MEKKKYSFKEVMKLFFTFMKIGAFTFGGGYAMVPLIEEEVSKKRKWISEEETLNILAISETTPGPISVNAATYVGYKVAGVWGAIMATLGLIIPSFVIILILSFFYKEFLQIHVVQAIFKGLKVGVIILLFRAFLKLTKGVKINGISITLFVIALLISLAFSIFEISFRYTSLCLIVLGLVVGVVLTIINKKKGDLS